MSATSLTAAATFASLDIGAIAIRLAKDANYRHRAAEALMEVQARLDAALMGAPQPQAPVVPAGLVLLMADGKTPLLDYLAGAFSDDLMDDWTRGFEECKRRLHRILATQLAAHTTQRAEKENGDD